MANYWINFNKRYFSFKNLRDLYCRDRGCAYRLMNSVAISNQPQSWFVHR
jgi:hypothetical protein